MTLSLILVFAVYGYSQNSAAAPAKETKQSTTATCGKFTDKNGDGVCDNHQNNANCKGNANCCGKGMQHCKETCQGKGQGKGCAQSCSQAKGNGNGCQHRHGCGNQQGNNTTPPAK